MTWQCRKCDETNEEQFDACWNCRTPRDGKRRFTNRMTSDVGEDGSSAEEMTAVKLRYSTRTLLAVTTLLAVLCAIAAWWPWHVAAWLGFLAAALVGTTVMIHITYELASGVRAPRRRRR